jgi:hypothetical protein
VATLAVAMLLYATVSPMRLVSYSALFHYRNRHKE